MKPLIWLVIFILAIIILPQIISALAALVVILLIFAVAWIEIRRHFGGRK